MSLKIKLTNNLTMANDYKAFLDKLSKDLANYTKEEIDSALAGKAKFGIINKVVDKIRKEINKLDHSDLEKVLSGEIKFGIKKPRGGTSVLPDFHAIREFLDRTESREDAETYVSKVCKTKPALTKLAKYLELEIKSSDLRQEILFKIVNGTVGTRLKSNVFRSER